jgi:hypothetical protein
MQYSKNCRADTEDAIKSADFSRLSAFLEKTLAELNL